MMCQNVIEAYRKMVPRLKFSGPSRVAPVISEVTQIVAQQALPSQLNQIYHVLMIITVSDNITLQMPLNVKKLDKNSN